MFTVMLNVYIYKIKIYPHERAGQTLVIKREGVLNNLLTKSCWPYLLET